jgi:glycosyltransferase involved in cell wall biosynthesis
MNNVARSKIRVLHVISGDLWAGAEVMAFNLLKYLKEFDDLDISVVLLNEGRLSEELRANGIFVQVIEEGKSSFVKISQKIRKAVSEHQPHIIHSHRYKENILTFLASLSCRGTRLVSTQHGLPEAYAKQPGIASRLISKSNFFLMSRYFTTVAVSADIGRALVNDYGFHGDGIDVIHNGIPLPKTVFMGDVSGKFVIGSSGRLFPVKDYPLMVEIARVATQSGKGDVRFELAGDGPGILDLISLVAKYQLNDNFFLRGHQDDMDRFYKGLDIYINTSIHEGIPMTILEAMGHGLPVIAPAVGGIVEIVEDGKEGFLIGSRDPKDFADKILLLRTDRDLWAKMSRAAREKAEREFSAEIMGTKYRELYLRLVQSDIIRKGHR